MYDLPPRRRILFYFSELGPAHCNTQPACAATLHGVKIFTYSCGATTRTWIAYSAWRTLYMAWIRTHSSWMCSQTVHNTKGTRAHTTGSVWIECRILFPVPRIQHVGLPRSIGWEHQSLRSDSPLHTLTHELPALTALALHRLFIHHKHASTHAQGTDPRKGA